MGFELNFSYCDRLEGGGYDKANVKSLKKRVGKAEEEVPHEKAAATIMAQFARRDIWVESVEVYEFTKKKIDFKEIKNGFVIGGIKCSFEECGKLGVHAEPEPAPPLQVAIPEQIFHPSFGIQAVCKIGAKSDAKVNVADFQLLKKKPMRYEEFHPDPTFLDMGKVRRLAFTIGEKYPIYEERPAGNDNRLGMNYTTIDNNGQKQVLNDKHFLPTTSLIGGDQFNDRKDMELQFGDDGGFGGPIPDIRR